MAVINIPTKNTNDNLTASEFNEVVTAIKLLQESTGYGVYFDNEFTDATPQPIVGDGNFVQLKNNAGSSISTYLPKVNSVPFELYDGTDIKVPSLGSSWDGYMSFYAKSSNSNTYFTIGIDIDGSFNEIFSGVDTFPRGADTYHPFYIPLNGYMLDTFLNNGGTPKINVQNGRTVDVYGMTLYINIQKQPI